MDFKEIGRQVMGWIQFCQNRFQWRDLVNTIMMGLRSPYEAVNLAKNW